MEFLSFPQNNRNYRKGKGTKFKRNHHKAKKEERITFYFSRVEKRKNLRGKKGGAGRISGKIFPLQGQEKRSKPIAAAWSVEKS